WQPVRAQNNLTRRSLSRQISKGTAVVSFSSLVAGRAGEAELPDRDSLWGRMDDEVEQPVAAPRVRRFMDFPRGRRAGRALHEILERADFALRSIEAADGQVRDTLAQFGFEAAWKESVLQMLNDVFSTPLESDNGDFALSSVPQTQRLHELEF